MSLLSARRALFPSLLLSLALPFAAVAQTNYYSTNGTEYKIVGSLLGDQVFPDVAINSSGGFVVWQDNATDGSGWGISARQLDATFSGTYSTFRVNFQGSNDQQNAHVALLKGGGAVFVWQGGAPSKEHIFARFMTNGNTFITSDVPVSTFTNNFQITPAVAVLNNGNVIVVWASFNQANSNSLQDVYGQILSTNGQPIGSNFLVNQFTTYNQRTPAVAALANGGFVVTWVSEQQRTVGSAPSQSLSSGQLSAYLPSVDIYARFFGSDATPLGNEMQVNTDSNPTANPGVAGAADGSCLVVWGGHDMANRTNSWDIYARSFSSTGTGGAPVIVNAQLYGDQYAPRVSALGNDFEVVWTSLAQDGSREGVFGRFVHSGGALVGNELRINTTTLSSQMQPAVASDGSGQFLVVWTSYTGSPYNFDLFAQRYGNVAALLQPMSAPFVYAPFVISNNVYQPQLQVAWPYLQGISVSNYEIYADGATTPIAVVSGTTNQWLMTAANNLTTNSSHFFAIDYVTTAGARSPLSATNGWTTWTGNIWNGLPSEWMAQFFGGYFGGTYHTTYWPSPTAPLVPNGPTLTQVFLSGGNPLDPSTWLTTTLTKTAQGLYLSWNTQAGFTYQVQQAGSVGAWTNLGSPRFAAGTVDSIYVGGNAVGFYRILLVR